MTSPTNPESWRNELACPYFMPVERFENGAWAHPARLPLGGGWSGHCTAPGHEGETPSQQVLEKLCNLGYAGSCGWTPHQRAWDAVRFAVSAPSAISGLGESRTAETGIPSRIVRLRYVCERNHLPVEHGDLEFDLPRAIWLRPHGDVRLQKMAECFLDSYLNLHMKKKDQS
jgi:hypothetical protein